MQPRSDCATLPIPREETQRIQSPVMNHRMLAKLAPSHAVGTVIFGDVRIFEAKFKGNVL